MVLVFAFYRLVVAKFSMRSPNASYIDSVLYIKTLLKVNNFTLLRVV